MLLLKKKLYLRLIKILISAYACEPDKGSEPEIGWQWVKHLSQLCELTVITRANNRDAIETDLDGICCPNLKFEYIDLSSACRSFKKLIRLLDSNWKCTDSIERRPRC